MIRTLILLVCVATMAAATMTACDVEDNPADSGQNDEIVLPAEATAKELIGGWSETERRKMNADGSLQDPVDWSMLDGGEANCIEIAADSIYFFLGNYTYKDGYLAYHYTYDSEIVAKEIGLQYYSLDSVGIHSVAFDKENALKLLKNIVGMKLFQ